MRANGYATQMRAKRTCVRTLTYAGTLEAHMLNAEALEKRSRRAKMIDESARAR